MGYLLITALAASLVGPDARGEMPAAPAPGAGTLPEAVTEANFTSLTEHSPFLRSIGLSQSIVLTGMARIGDDVIAILHDLETRESYLVSEETNSQGWQLMEVKGNPTELKTLTAQIKVAGSEVVSIRYEKIPPRAMVKGGTGKPGSGSGSIALTSDQVAEAKQAAVNYREGFDADGYSRQPPAEIVAKLARMTPEQREAINRQMFELHNRGMGMEQRRPIYEKLVDRTLQSGR